MKLVKSSVTKLSRNIDVNARMARDEMTTALIQLSKEQIKGRRPKGEVAWKGFPTPPMNRTGKLRQSITAEKFRTGFASYSAVIGPTIIYARRVELGGGNWKPGVRFPYMEPAYAQFRSMVAPQITRKYFKGVSSVR